MPNPYPLTDDPSSAPESVTVRDDITRNTPTDSLADRPQIKTRPGVRPPPKDDSSVATEER